MYQLIVDDVDQVWDQILESDLLNRHENVRATEPRNEPWGRVLYLWGPCRELWHFTQPRS
ncbi:MAG TPA: hypothetical protein DCM54_15505 [Gammaproteobacteria bacterium]|nr:hypothetical protein [Gammaproteobacteria bacterium]